MVLLYYRTMCRIHRDDNNVDLDNGCSTWSRVVHKDTHLQSVHDNVIPRHKLVHKVIHDRGVLTRPFAEQLSKDMSLDAIILPYSGHSDDWLVYIASYVEDFKALVRVSKFQGNVILLRDSTNHWYDNKEDVFEQWLLLHIPSQAKITFVGQSMGAYFAMLMGSRISGVVLAFSPQSIQSRDNMVWFHPTISSSHTPPHFKDLRKQLKNSSHKSPNYVIVSCEETFNLYQTNPAFFWADMVQAGHLIGLPRTKVCILPSDCHAMFGATDFMSLANMILSHWNDLQKEEVDVLSHLKTNYSQTTR